MWSSLFALQSIPYSKLIHLKLLIKEEFPVFGINETPEMNFHNASDDAKRALDTISFIVNRPC
jgi:hypothetical protein